MLFFFKPKPIIVDAFTPSEIIANQYAITASNKHTPDWWKALPADLAPDPKWPRIFPSTMKRCQGLIDFYANSYTLPLWTDLNIELDYSRGNREARYACADQTTHLEIHNNEQYKGFVDPRKFQHYKILAPWYLNSTSEVMWSYAPATWNHGSFLNELTVLPGQINFKYQNVLHINTLTSIGPNLKTSIMIEAGTPMVTLTPLTERPVEIRTHAITADEYNKKLHVSKFQGLYKENKLRRCPFH